MLDIKFVRENPDLVKENIKKKFEDHKLHLVDEVIDLDKKIREKIQLGSELRAKRNSLSQEIGKLMREKNIEKANENKAQVVEINKQLEDIEKDEESLNQELTKRMLVIPNIIDPSVPIGKDDSENQEIEKFGEPVPEFRFRA